MEHDQFNLRQTAVANVERFVERYAPGFDLPATFGGHLVGTDAVADLAFTLGLLRRGGVDSVAGLPVDDAIARVLRQVDGPETHSFFSYRVAETLAGFGSFDDNPIVATMSSADVENLRVACDSTALFELLDAKLLPPNYLAVLARCELARQRLGILPDDSRLDEMVERTAAMLAANPSGFLDESHEGTGRYDIYTADLYLFCEPLAPLLGERWTDGVRRAVELVETIGTSDGSSFAWGRSTGVLSLALTVELAGLAAHHGLTSHPAAWTASARRAAAAIPRWFGPDGVVTAHLRGRSTEDYRGPQRRLQMTFDVLGKLAASANPLDDAVPDDAAPVARARHELVRFDDRAAVWSFRNERTEFVMPFVSGRSSDYVPSPRRPGLFDVPVDSPLACFLPMVHTPGSAISPQGRFVPGETPKQIERTLDGVVVEYDRFVATRSIDAGPPPPDLAATRRAEYRVDGAALTVTEHLTFVEPPAAVSILVPESRSRPLRVTIDGPADARLRTVGIGGMKEWASTWTPLDSLTEIELTPAREMEFTWSVAPVPVVHVTLNHHHYVRTVYDPISERPGGRVAERPWGGDLADAGDVAHLHWPEWCFGFGRRLDEHQAIAARLRSEGTRIAWTQHNLTPHLDEPDVYDPIYQAWAEVCDLAIHHSDWGRRQVLERYEFADDCRHVVIPHPHFGPLVTPNAHVDRDEAARLLGLDAGPAPAIRIGIIGAPRKEKDVQLVIDALLASGRDDIQLAIWSMSFTDAVPDDPRIVTELYANADRATYDLRLAACDAIALPFTGHTMLATGTASDLVATGTPGLVSDWPYLVEHLGDAGIAMGQTVESWAAGLASLDADRLRDAAAATAALQDRYAPERIAAATADAIEALGRRDG
ncbi:MAG: hypothetical protein U0Q22_08605 [Acidimicrobiales bacterium]